MRPCRCAEPFEGEVWVCVGRIWQDWLRDPDACYIVVAHEAGADHCLKPSDTIGTPPDGADIDPPRSIHDTCCECCEANSGLLPDPDLDCQSLEDEDARCADVGTWCSDENPISGECLRECCCDRRGATGWATGWAFFDNSRLGGSRYTILANRSSLTAKRDAPASAACSTSAQPSAERRVGQ